MKIGEVGGRRWDSRKEEKVEKIGEKDSAQKKNNSRIEKKRKTERREKTPADLEMGNMRE
jgi:hypothetical protein